MKSLHRLKQLTEVKITQEYLDELDITAQQEWELEDAFHRYLDETYGDVEIVGYKYSTSRVFKNADPTAYRQAFNEFLNDNYKYIGSNVRGYVTKDEYARIEDPNLR